jgi:hypothetical protein
VCPCKSRTPDIKPSKNPYLQVWKDTRGSLNPILPRKPYPVFRLPSAGRGGSAIDPLMEASETLTEFDEEAQEGAGVGSGVEDLD